MKNQMDFDIFTYLFNKLEVIMKKSMCIVDGDR